MYCPNLMSQRVNRKNTDNFFWKESYHRNSIDGYKSHASKLFFESSVLPFSWVNTQEKCKTKAKKLDGTTKRSMKKETFPSFFILLFLSCVQKWQIKVSLCIYTQNSHRSAKTAPNWRKLHKYLKKTFKLIKLRCRMKKTVRLQSKERRKRTRQNRTSLKSSAWKLAKQRMHTRPSQENTSRNVNPRKDVNAIFDHPT